MRGTMTDEPTVTIGKHTNNTTVYHTNPQCRYVTETHNTRTREILDAWGYQHCELCANNGNPDTYVPSKQSTTRIDVNDK